MYNKITIVGRIGKDPELKNFNTTSQAIISVASSEDYKDKNGEWVSNTTWHRVVIWGKLAEAAPKFLKKGDLILVEGKQENRSYEDRDGNTRHVSEIKVAFDGTIKRLNKRESQNGAYSESYNSANNSNSEQMAESFADGKPSFMDDDDDDLPF